jgi:hypothetical protein
MGVSQNAVPTIDDEMVERVPVFQLRGNKTFATRVEGASFTGEPMSTVRDRIAVWSVKRSEVRTQQSGTPAILVADKRLS